MRRWTGLIIALASLAAALGAVLVLTWWLW